MKQPGQASLVYGKRRVGKTRLIREALNRDYLGLTVNPSMITVIGERGTDSCDANVRVLQALAAAGVPISTINQGAGKLNLLVGVPEEKYEEARRAIYAAIDDPAD